MPYTYEYPHPAITTDAVLFGVRDARLQVLLIQRRHAPYAGQWAFPGGFLDDDEELLACAERELQEETGVTGVALTPLLAADKPERDPRERNISVVFMGLVRPDDITATASDDAAAVDWFSAWRPPKLAFDHRDILAAARKALLRDIETTDAARSLLPKRFTLDQLREVFEAVGNRKLDRPRFRRRASTLDWVAPTDHYARNGARYFRSKKQGKPTRSPLFQSR